MRGKSCFFSILCCVPPFILLLYSIVFSRPLQQWSAPEKLVLELVNLQRSYHGLPWLKANSALQEAARLHSLDMGNNDYFSHTSQSGITFAKRITRQGYRWNHVGENIAAGYADAYAVMYGTDDLKVLSDFDVSRGYGGFVSWREVGDRWTESDWDAWNVHCNQHGGWMGSSGHRHNILDPVYEDVGIGYVDVVTSQYKEYWTQDFGSGDTSIVAILSTPSSPAAGDGSQPDYVQLTWQRADSALYQVIRCPGRNLDNCVDIYQGDATKAMDTTAVDRIVYYYCLRVCNESGCSGYSQCDSGYRDSVEQII